jgi:hypothetical protein
LEHLRELVTPGEARRVGLALADAYRQTGQDAALVAGRDLVIGDNSIAVGRVVAGRDITVALNAGEDITGRDQITFQAGRDVTIIPDPSNVMLGAVGLLLPPDISDFTGRAEVLSAARTALAEHRAVALIGLAGIGKTAAAVRLVLQLHGYGEFPDSPVYVNLRGTEAQPADATDVLADLLAALGVPGRELRSATSAQLADLYKKALADRRMVVVLDNAASVDQIAPLLPPAPNVALITSRSGAALPPEAAKVVVDTLTAAEAPSGGACPDQWRSDSRDRKKLPGTLDPFKAWGPRSSTVMLERHCCICAEGVVVEYQVEAVATPRTARTAQLCRSRMSSDAFRPPSGRHRAG